MGDDVALEQFQNFGPPKFTRELDPEQGENWLENMINIFAVMRYSKERHVTFVIFQFKGAARSWWNIIKTRWDRESTPWTWANFIEEFNNKYISIIVREKRDDKFISLKQRTNSIAEYKAQFTQL